MPDLPIMLKVAGRRCVIVGGGKVAHRRAEALLAAGAEVVVIAPEVDEAIRSLPVTVLARAYQAGDLADARLVVIATNDATVNERIAEDATAAGVLVNRTDQPDAGDFTVPAHHHHGPVTLAVHTGGASAQAAATIRRELSASLDGDWPVLLDTIKPYRARIQAACPDPAQRLDRLRRLTDARAMTILKTQGLDALRQYCEGIVASC